MRRTRLAMITTIALLVHPVPGSAQADKPRTTRPPGFDLGALTFDQAVALPATQRGLADGVYTLADIQAFFDAVDRNNNDLACFKDIYSLTDENPNPASGRQYDFIINDDNASKP